MNETAERVLEALRAVTADGWPASVRDVQRQAEIPSPSTAQRYLVWLEEQGLAERSPRHRNGWRPVEAPR